MERELPQEPLAIDIGESRLHIPDLQELCDFLKREHAKGTILSAGRRDGLADPIDRVSVTARNIEDRLNLSTAVILGKKAGGDAEKMFRRHVIGGDVEVSDALHPTAKGYERKAKPTPGANIAVYKASKPKSGLKIAVAVAQEARSRRVEITNYQHIPRKSYTFRPRHIPSMKVEQYLEDFLTFSLIALNALSHYVNPGGSLPRLSTRPVAELPPPTPKPPKPPKAKPKHRKPSSAPKQHNEILEAPGTPPVDEMIIEPVESKPRLSDIGGYEEVKRQIEKVVLSYQRPEIAALWDDPAARSVLFHGPPGTAKTTLAEIIATELGAKKRIIESTDIYDMYVSNSAKNMKKLFEELFAIEEPTVVIFDELESIVSMQGSQERIEAAGVFKREMVRLQCENKHVIIVATTNHRGSIDPAITRSGRFDKHIHVDLPNEAAREAIWLLKMSPLFWRTAIDDSLEVKSDFKPFGDMSIEELRETAKFLAGRSEGLSGADIENIFRDVRETKMIEHMKEGTYTPIDSDSIEHALRNFRENQHTEE